MAKKMRVERTYLKVIGYFLDSFTAALKSEIKSLHTVFGLSPVFVAKRNK
jgi:hypothetical protein